ncbi:proteasome subunit beta type-6 [Teleopsis dalmanni]|uniref:proteasome subunit beta type-6-like n=1 Tax=Teleopsis dalmanni TaxID=139649 RepID=UPI0018CDCFC6|nr:proteasome subunit beta type-6-like [Teleopsis dalmanni]XP_037948355.1 proteasome subunit beta type-6 [Teleopsis dalmanni]
MVNGMDWMDKAVSTGTTIMAVEFEGGVVIGADSRTSSGSYVANRVTDKLTRISDKIYCCRSGSAADTQAIADIVAYALEYQENQTDQPPLVSDAAHEFRNYCYNYRSSLVAGIIVAGWDVHKGGQVFTIPLGGMVKREPVAIGGSGSGYIYGFIKELYHPGMSKEECVELVKKAVRHAQTFDGSSGGVVRIGIVTANGLERRTFFSTPSGEGVATDKTAGVEHLLF